MQAGGVLVAQDGSFCLAQDSSVLVAQDGSFCLTQDSSVFERCHSLGLDIFLVFLVKREEIV